MPSGTGDPSELDAARFEQLVAEARSARPERAAEKLCDALALWRAPPLADLAYEPFAQEEIARLEELHLGAVEQRIEADLATGRHADVVAELEALIGRHPLRERLRGQLMLALYELLIPYGDRVAVGYPEISTGAVARYLGLLATTLERWDDAERHLRDALEINERIGARSWLAHTQHDYARMLLSRDATGDSEQAQLLASAAVATYRDLGMHTYVESASALRR